MSNQISGQTTVTTAGTAVSLGSGVVNGSIMVRALNANTGNMYIGNDGNDDVSSASGFELPADAMVIFEYIDKLEDIYVDASVNGEKVCWVIIDQSNGV